MKFSQLRTGEKFEMTEVKSTGRQLDFDIGKVYQKVSERRYAQVLPNGELLQPAYRIGSTICPVRRVK